MLPRERSLAKRFEGRPFVVLGVNAEASAEALRRAEEKEHLPFRSWWDGLRGPIATAAGRLDATGTFTLTMPPGAAPHPMSAPAGRSCWWARA